MKLKDKSTETMLVLTVGCIVVYLASHAKAVLWVGLVLGLTGILSGYLSRQIDWAWTGLARGLGVVSNGVLLSVIYLFVVVPVGIVRRMRKKDLTWFDPKATSNFKVREHLFGKEDLENTW
jgi:RsiW-degrading membrane proteinase PrsW (M82 family)